MIAGAALATASAAPTVAEASAAGAAGVGSVSASIRRAVVFGLVINSYKFLI